VKGCFCFHVRIQPESSPYKGIGPIFVREAAEAPYVGYDEIPAQIAPRLMPVDARHYIVAADVTPGAQLGELAERLF
jgi:hypothetical protein